MLRLTPGGYWIDIQPARSRALAREAAQDLPPCKFWGAPRIMPEARLYAGSVFGEDLFVGDGASISEGCRVGARCVIGRGVTIGPGVVLGDDVRVMDLTHLTGGMEIGAGSFLGVGVVTANDPRPLPYVYDVARLRPPVVGAGVMVGSGAVLCPGVRVGDGAWIAAGALVARDVAPGARVRGRRAE